MKKIGVKQHNSVNRHASNNKTVKWFRKNRNEVMIVAGAVGLAVSTFFVGLKTPKFKEFIEEEKKAQETEKLPIKDVAKIAAKSYISPALGTVASASLIIGGLASNCKKNEAFASMCMASNAALKQYKERVIETVGEEKEKEIAKKVVVKDGEIVEDIDDVSDIMAYANKDKVYTFIDSYSGRRFKCTKNKLDHVKNILNERLLTEYNIYLNEYYDEIGLKHTDAGEILLWNADEGLLNIKYEPMFDDYGNITILVSFTEKPSKDYYK